ncbi:uncharacterized protein LOC127776945 [Oryza glaberrima]|uniref:uncharacterized protein LOC127776945 n=1 Tax=Oryza glaberrima TaxID=4538 RepID=UPI00224C535E|nr:uncharacterized protein LOC127776945 [Oryza glaberrima]
MDSTLFNSWNYFASYQLIIDNWDNRSSESASSLDGRNIVTVISQTLGIGATSFLCCNPTKCDVGMVIGGYAQDPYDDSGLEELMQDEDALEKSVFLIGIKVEIKRKGIMVVTSIYLQNLIHGISIVYNNKYHMHTS